MRHIAYILSGALVFILLSACAPSPRAPEVTATPRLVPVATATPTLLPPTPVPTPISMPTRGPRLEASLTANARCPTSPRRAPSGPRPTTLVLPILMYHHLQPVAASATVLLRGLTVTPTEFDAQAAYLEQHHYHTITFAELVAYLNDRAGLPENPIILTFDDGWREGYTVAFPVLRKHCLTGTFFPPIKWIGQAATVLTWDEIMEMSAGGMEFGSHTLNHHLLANQTADEIHEQLRGSKAILEARLGKPVVALAYPANSFNALVESIAEDEGYGVALTTNAGIYQNTNELFSLHRTAIRFVDTLEAFASKISVPPVASGRLR